jgi:hypothetical protein
MFPTHNPGSLQLLVLEPPNLKQTGNSTPKPKLLLNFSAKMPSRPDPHARSGEADLITKAQRHHPFNPPHGTRISGRLRRVKPDQDEDWESVPDESLTEDNSEPPPRRSTRATRLRRKSPEVTDSESDQEDQKLIKTGLEYDESVSDLTDLSSEHGDDPCGDHVSAEDNDGDRGKCNGEIPMERKQSDVNPDNIPEEFIEWEMV